jgi:hypothetical protein
MTPYQRRALTQGRLWIKGMSYHNSIDDECCPDFSCCYPEMGIMDKKERIKRVQMWIDLNNLNIDVTNE